MVVVHLLTIVCLSGFSLLKTNFKSSSSSMFEDYFRDIMSPYFEFQKFNSCCRLIHLGGGLHFNYLLFVQKIAFDGFYPLLEVPFFSIDFSFL